MNKQNKKEYIYGVETNKEGKRGKVKESKRKNKETKYRHAI
jgi:hypothetical protein